MIKLTVMPSRKIKRSKNSLYIKFMYSNEFNEMMNLLKQYPKRYYHQDIKAWELNTKFFLDILNTYRNYNLSIIGELPKDLEKQLDLYDRLTLEPMDNYSSKTKPFNHQLESFEFAKYNDKFILGDEQGLGKTKQAIDIAVAHKHKFKHCLIVCCVNGLKWNWLNEIAIHSNEKGHIIGSRINKVGKVHIGTINERLEDLKLDRPEYFLITNIETLRDDKIATQLNKMCADGTIGIVIADEIHKCVNSTSKQGKSIHKLTSIYKIAMTGTPLMNTPIDLYNILKWIGVEHHSLTEFKSYYCNLGGIGGNEIVSYKHLPELQKLLNGVMLRRKKEDVLDLPPKIRTTEYVEMDKQQSSLYNDIKNNICDNIDKICLMPNPLVELIRLRQCTGNPSIISSKCNKSAKYDRMLEIIEECANNNEKVIVFSNWTSVINPAYKLLKKFNPAIITGEVKDRQEQEYKFQNDESCKVILGTIQAMGTGLTLTKASTVIFLDSPWNMSNKEQAEDRAHRIGTTKPVNIITIVCKDTIDERIEDIIYYKSGLSNMLVDGKAMNKIDKDTISYLLS